MLGQGNNIKWYNVFLLKKFQKQEILNYTVRGGEAGDKTIF